MTEMLMNPVIEEEKKKKKTSEEKYKVYKNKFIQRHYVSYSLRIYYEFNSDAYKLFENCTNKRKVIIDALWKEYNHRKSENDTSAIAYGQKKTENSKLYKAYCLRLSRDKEKELIDMLDNTTNKCGFIGHLLDEEYRLKSKS